MTTFDWIVLVSSLVFIVSYGVWKGRGSKDMRGYLLSGNDMKWYTICLSIMATQASAITFMSTPGQSYIDGMRFVQFYFGLPLAMVILSVTAVPIYHRLKIYTAYEYLETQFDLKTRLLAVFLFTIQRGLGAGLTIYAPSIILSVLLGWNLYWTNIIMGGLVIIYTASGGTRAVSWTQTHQMIIITAGMIAAFGTMIYLLPPQLSFIDAMHVAGKMEKLNTIDFSFNLNDRYTIWSGIIGGLFLQLAYFGTDQSQVGRYLTGQSVTQSRLGLLCNGLVKVPMQFSILFLGVMLFVFYQFVTPPVFFNTVETQKLQNGRYAAEYKKLEEHHATVFKDKEIYLNNLLTAIHDKDESKIAAIQQELKISNDGLRAIRSEATALMQLNDPSANTNDANYIFLNFVITYLPVGLVGLVIAAIFAASMSSTASELNALASTTVVDIYRRLIKKQIHTSGDEKQTVLITKLATVFWGIYAIFFAQFASLLGSLIEAVNILGSLFYGTILGIFLVGFYMKFIRGTSVFFAAIAAEITVILCFLFSDISFLWYNVIGCLLVMLLSLVFQTVIKEKSLREI
ncbi:sodium:solute symporter [bacterium]|nr:sodium:solute symporter [bacterium]